MRSSSIPILAMAIRIERIQIDEEYEEIERVQREVWSMEDIDVVPRHLLISVQAHGGLVLGAYDEEGRMVGMLFGVSAFKDGRAYHYSHLCGVIPERRFRGVGYQLKVRQREYAMSQGLDLVIWTYDPLEGANGHFNLSKLGALCRIYKRNYYGFMRDLLNRGLETDRFQVEWWIRSKRASDRIECLSSPPQLDDLFQRGGVLVNKTKVLEAGVTRCISQTLEADAEIILVEIPESNQKVKAVSMELAREWRFTTRNIFEHYFSRDYVATELISGVIDGIARNFYVLIKGYQVE